MNISKKTSLIILCVTSAVCSRTLFALFNDPEGPNLLIVVGMAVFLYFFSLAVYLRLSSTTTLKRLLLAVATQIIMVVGLYLFLK